MNEWLIEKSVESHSKQVKSEPLEVAVEENMFVTCLPSPRNSMDRLRRNSQTSCVRERSASQHGENSAGSAKKVITMSHNLCNVLKWNNKCIVRSYWDDISFRLDRKKWS